MKLPMPKLKNHKYTALAYFLPCFIFLLIAFVDYVRAYFGDNKKIHDVEA